MTLHTPLAEQLRPQNLGEVIGQPHLLGVSKPLRVAFETGRAHSMILWGPPGVGKTTLARLMADAFHCQLIALSAVLAGVKEIREAVAHAQNMRALHNQQTLVFVDEVHRFNKSQQDAFLPHVENGLFVFVGATTENPSFEVNSALLSRAAVYVLKSLDTQALSDLIDRALLEVLNDYSITDDARQILIAAADGDARKLLNMLEISARAVFGNGAVQKGKENAAAQGAENNPTPMDAVGNHLANDVAYNAAHNTANHVTHQTANQPTAHVIDAALLNAALSENLRRFDKGGDAFYDQISALHKSVRGSNPDAALYWLLRMLDGGADPRYLARRMVRMASEDIGLADPRALRITLDAADVYERLGSPEGELALGQAAIYLACAAKSNAVYVAYNAARAFIAKDASRSVPEHLRNAPTKLMKQLGYGKTYRYAHDEPHAYAAGETYLPEGLPVQTWYQPTNRGLEIKIGEKMNLLKKWDEEAGKK